MRLFLKKILYFLQFLTATVSKSCGPVTNVYISKTCFKYKGTPNAFKRFIMIFFFTLSTGFHIRHTFHWHDYFFTLCCFFLSFLSTTLSLSLSLRLRWCKGCLEEQRGCLHGVLIPGWQSSSWNAWTHHGRKAQKK